MHPVSNPFSPGAGTPPPELAGRGPLLEKADLALARIRRGRSAKGLILAGLRGVGKTVLLNEIARRAERDGYRAIQLESPEDRALRDQILVPIRQLLLQLDAMAHLSHKVKRALRVLKSFALRVRLGGGEIELGIEPELGAADSGDLETDLAVLLQAVGEAASDRGTAVALCIDEIQYLDDGELSALIKAFHGASQRQLPLVLFGAGLPQIIGNAGRAKSYAERLFEFPEVGPLSDADAMAALQEPVRQQGVTFTQEALDEILRVTGGYPFFLQQWGYEAWNLAVASPIDLETVRRATEVAIRGLDESFFRVRFDRLTLREKRYVRAMAAGGGGPQRSGDIAGRLGVRVNSVAPVRNSLIRKGMIYSPAHGDAAFTVPQFDRYLLRVMPEG